MRRVAATAASLATLIALTATAVPAVAGTSGVKGVVLDTSCYGPCSVNQHPKPYTGDGAYVVVRRLPDLERVARVTPEKGRFMVDLPPGTYRLWADVRGECWQGEAKRRTVSEGEFAYVRLHVYNRCIV
jgi:hypothetical protein